MLMDNRKTILITGGSRGIGAAISIAFANEGGRVIIVYKSNLQAARNTLKQLVGTGHEAYQCDVTKPAEVARLFKHVKAEYPSIDIIVNNAGIGFHHPVDRCSYQEWQNAWQQIMSSNLIGPSNVCYQAAQLMISQKRGYIINVGYIEENHLCQPMDPAKRDYIR